MRPPPARFMAGATAWAHQKAPVRFTSMMARQSCSVISSSGRPTWPTTPPALCTRMSMRPVCCSTVCASACTAARSVTSSRCGAAAIAGEAGGFGEFVGKDVGGPDLGAERGELARDRPAEAVRGAGDDGGAAIESRCSCRHRPASSSRFAHVHRSRSLLDLVDHRDQPRGDRCVRSVLPRGGYDRSELRVSLGLALADRQVAPDAAMGFGGMAVVLHQRVQRTAGARRSTHRRRGRSRRTAPA